MVKFVPAKDSVCSDKSYTKVAFFNPCEEMLVQSVSPTSTSGLGFVHSSQIPEYRRHPIDKIPKSVEIPSDEEVLFFLKIFKGIGPYDPADPWKKKMFHWGIFTHEKEHLYMQEMLL